MCNLRGILMQKLNRGDQAKQCFMEALALDVKCFDAFEQLINGEMMTPQEGMPLNFCILACSHVRFRMGICPISCVLITDASRRIIRTADLYRAPA